MRALADRRLGVGCDSVIALEASGVADVRMRIWNADGGEAGACGNATRCVAWLLARTRGGKRFDIEVGDRVLHAEVDGERVSVDMGAPGLGWRDIPLAWEMDTREIQLRVTPELSGPGCVSMGNPHAVFFVDDVLTAPVERVGPIVENHWLFPGPNQRRLLPAARARSPAPARLGARRRPDAGLRHRRLRRPGGGAPARPVGPRSDARARRRRARHPLARGGRPRDHVWSGGGGVHRPPS